MGRFQVQVYDRETRKVFATAIENIGKERDFNTVQFEGVEPDALEGGLAKFEGELAPALERTIAASTFPSDDDKAYVLNLVGLFTLRNPRWRETMRQFREDVAFKTMDLVLASKERYEAHVARARRDGFIGPDASDISYEEMKALCDARAFRVEVPNEMHVQTEFEGFDTLLPYLFRRKWVFLRASASSGGFVTSDHPVNLVWSDPIRAGQFYSPGFGLKGTEVLFPLSSRLAMIGAFDVENATINASDEMVAHFNGAAISMAARQVYARDHNFQYKRSPTEQSRKASRLIDDPQFHRERERRESENDDDSEEAA